MLLSNFGHLIDSLDVEMPFGVVWALSYLYLHFVPSLLVAGGLGTLRVYGELLLHRGDVLWMLRACVRLVYLRRDGYVRMWASVRELAYVAMLGEDEIAYGLYLAGGDATILGR